MNTYIIKEIDSDRVKIGKADDVIARLKQHQCSNASELIVIMIEPENIEAELHQQFHKSRIHREWFHYTDDIKAYVESKAIQTKNILDRISKPQMVKVAPIMRKLKPKLEPPTPRTNMEKVKAMVYQIEAEVKLRRKEEPKEIHFDLPEGMTEHPDNLWNIRTVINRESPQVQHILKIIIKQVLKQNLLEVSFPYNFFYSNELGITSDNVDEYTYRVFRISFTGYGQRKRLGRITYRSNSYHNLVGQWGSPFASENILEEEKIFKTSLMNGGLNLIRRHYPKFLE